MSSRPQILERPTVKITGAAVFVPISVLLQALPPIFLTPWFMRVDLVGVSWVLCWSLFGFKSALLSLLISVPLVGVLGPFAGGWVGAVMKSVASVWMFAVPAAFARFAGGYDRLVERKSLFALASLAAIVVRDAITAVFNFYFAIPFFFGMSGSDIVAFFSTPRFQSFLGLSLGLVGVGAYVAEIIFWNTVQGAIDIYSSLPISHLVKTRVFGSRRKTAPSDHQPP
jgi:riboflavin transporter FmnP